jgi:SAM-dependent methyltransferase/uncharacterized protein YbaR (Trm112 family)
MHISTANNYIDILNSQKNDLMLKIFKQEKDHVIEGVLLSQSSLTWYPILNGVPCFLTGHFQPDLRDFAQKYNLKLVENPDTSHNKTGQEITNESFSSKWSKFKNYGHEPEHKDFLFGWYQKKLGVDNLEDLKKFYSTFDKILEIGPGSGFNTRFMAEATKGHIHSLDISDAAFTTYENTKDLPNCSVVQADLMKAPFANNSFDFIIADGVLHHTPNTFEAVKALYQKLKPGGKFFFYVYKKMGAARYFCDNHIRETFTKLTTEECYEHCESLTDLGKALSQLKATITLEKPIPVLGIPAGTHDIQRLLYYNFVKCFWNDAFDYETNNMVNFDWYHPHHAWQHTEEEVHSWMKELGCNSYSFQDANPNGLSVLLIKPSL